MTKITFDLKYTIAKLVSRYPLQVEYEASWVSLEATFMNSSDLGLGTAYKLTFLEPKLEMVLNNNKM